MASNKEKPPVVEEVEAELPPTPKGEVAVSVPDTAPELGESLYDLSDFIALQNLDAFEIGYLAHTVGQYARPLAQWHAAMPGKENP